MKTSEAIDKLAEALAKAQGEMENPEKTRTAKIEGTTKTGKPFSYTYNYADLPGTFDAARKALAKYELSHTAASREDSTTKETFLEMRLMHSSGQWIESELLLSGDDEKTLAASQTFSRRYLFMGLTGIAGDEDNDVPQGGQGQYSDKKPTQGPAPLPRVTPSKPVVASPKAVLTPADQVRENNKQKPEPKIQLPNSNLPDF